MLIVNVINIWLKAHLDFWVVAGYLDLVKIPMDRLHYAVSAPVSE